MPKKSAGRRTTPAKRRRITDIDASNPEHVTAGGGAGACTCFFDPGKGIMVGSSSCPVHRAGLRTSP